MKYRSLITCCVVLLIVLTFVSAVTYAAVPNQINYQGFLTDADGNPADGTYNISFAIYNTPEGVTSLWGESREVTVTNGIYNVILGQGIPIEPNILDGDGNLYLGVTVEGDAEMLPRQKLTATAFSLKAAKADSVSNGAITSVMIADDAVDSNKVANDAITSAKILNDTVTADDIHDGSGSGLDADKLDGLEASYFMPSGEDNWVDETGDSMTGPLSVPYLQIDGSTAFKAENHNTFLGLNVGTSNTTGSSNTFIGEQAGSANTHGNWNTFIGRQSGDANTTGYSNTFIGGVSGLLNTTGNSNTFIGGSAGYANTIGQFNTFIGEQAGHDNSEGNWNTFIGRQSGDENTIGSSNTFVGGAAGHLNTTGYYNTFIGASAGAVNTEGSWNTFIGRQSGDANTTGYSNTFVGGVSGQANTTGYSNTFIGGSAGYANTTGLYNTFMGDSAGHDNTIGFSNTFIGGLAGNDNSTGQQNTFIGASTGHSNTTGHYNTFIGENAGYTNETGNGNLFLGYRAGYNETDSNKLYIANSDTSTPLIYGDFGEQELTINGDLAVSGGIEFSNGTVQTTATAPTWHQILPAADRFELVMGDNAVLDKETGLVWAKDANQFGAVSWINAITECRGFSILNRMGWRLPTAEELLSLVDPSQSDPSLPDGHPFINVMTSTYWTSTTSESDSERAWWVSFHNGVTGWDGYKTGTCYVWPVRGGNGYATGRW